MSSNGHQNGLDGHHENDAGIAKPMRFFAIFVKSL